MPTTYLSDFHLPKDFSKKKKLELSTAIYSPADDVDSFQWVISNDHQRLYLTIEDAVIEALTKKLEEGCSPESLKKGSIWILSMEFPVTEFNDRPCNYGPTGEPLDAEFDRDTLSFLVTLQNREPEASNLSRLAIDEMEIDDSGKIVSIKSHQKVTGYFSH